MSKEIIITSRDLIIEGMSLINRRGQLNENQSDSKMTSLFIYDYGDIFCYEDEFKIVGENSSETANTTLTSECSIITKKGNQCSKKGTYTNEEGKLFCGIHARGKNYLKLEK